MAGTWNTLAPDGTKSVRRNVTILQTNTTYIKTNMQFDHFWDVSQTLDGHHRHVQTPIKDSDPTFLSTDMDGMYYMREKTDIEAPGAFQKAEPFHYSKGESGSNHYLQLGFRAMACFNTNGNNPIDQSGILYSQNLRTQSDSPKGIILSSSTGASYNYRFNFENPMPTANYIVSAMAVTSISSAGYRYSISSKTVNSFNLRIATSDIVPATQIMMSVCGG